MSQSESSQTLNNYLVTSIKTLLMAKALVSKEPAYKDFIDCYDELTDKHSPVFEERRERFPFYQSTFVEAADHLLTSIGTSEFCRSFDVFVNVYCEGLTSLAKTKKENGEKGLITAAMYLEALKAKLAEIKFPVSEGDGEVLADKILAGYQEFRNHQAHIRNLKKDITFYYFKDSSFSKKLAGASYSLKPDNAWFLGFEESMGAMRVIYKIAEALENPSLPQASSRPS